MTGRQPRTRWDGIKTSKRGGELAKTYPLDPLLVLPNRRDRPATLRATWPRRAGSQGGLARSHRHHEVLPSPRSKSNRLTAAASRPDLQTRRGGAGPEPALGEGWSGRQQLPPNG